MNDCLGRELKQGDIVVWPRQYGHRLSVRSGRVLGETDAGGLRVLTTTHVRPVGGGDNSSRLLVLHRIDNVVKVGVTCDRCGGFETPEVACHHCGARP
jgi:hypothetical protein